MGFESKVKARIEKTLCKIRDGDAIEEYKQEILLDEFDNLLFRINHKHEDLVVEAVEKAKDIKTLEGWPDNKQKFWDLEAANWKFRVPLNIKSFITDELNELRGKNLDVGCGTISYVKDSICLDLSHEMLGWNESKCKVQASAELLPFKKNSFDSITLIFTANYISDLNRLSKELFKVLKKQGKIICVQSSMHVNKLHQLVENKDFGVDNLIYSLNRVGLRTTKKIKKVDNTSLVFIEAVK